MERQQPVYSNAQAIEQLSKAFQNKAGENVSIPPRECRDVPEFIKRMQLAQELTRKNSIKFG